MSAGCAHSLHLTGVTGDPRSRIHRLDPRAKLLGFAAVTLIAVTTPAAAWPAWVACGLALLVVAALAHVGPGVIWQRIRFVLPLVAFVAVFLPFVRGGAQIDLGPFSVSEAGLVVFVSVTIKAFIGTVSAVLLGATTSFPDVLLAMERLRAPRIFVLIAGLMYRYLFVVIDETRRTRAALTARGYRPRNALQAGAIGRVVGALFLRSHARGERVHLAMLARGFTGRMPQTTALVMVRADVVFLALLGTLLVAARVAAEVVA